MHFATPETTDTLDRLGALLAEGTLSDRDTAHCAGLAESLRRPARVSLLCPEGADTDVVLRSLLGIDAGPHGLDGPTLEITHGPTTRVTATLSDGRELAQDGHPTPDLMRNEPVFLKIETPNATLAHMSLLRLSLGQAPAELFPALSWAARRTEIAIWCTKTFGVTDARIWAVAPESLKNYAYLVVTQAQNAAQLRTLRLTNGFDGAFAISRNAEAGMTDQQAAALRTRLMTDIDEARQADLDAAELFLHRLGRTSDIIASIASDIRPKPADRKVEAPVPAAETISLISEPLLYLKRRARALLEIIDWQVEEDDWPAEVLSHCCDTAEGLRERATDWPEDDTMAQNLQGTIEEACDTAILLQIEAGAAQASDAARLMQQLRCTFEEALAA